jgi:hypothetical protein|eukprot:COSAG01_NODE_1239_length_11087_cov_7.928376_6_plen_77_part_00
MYAFAQTFNCQVAAAAQLRQYGVSYGPMVLGCADKVQRHDAMSRTILLLLPAISLVMALSLVMVLVALIVLSQSHT